MDLVFGADGGGTKTLGLLCSTDGTVLARRTVGASNVNVVGFDGAARNLFELISGCCADASRSLGDIRSLVFGLAGAGREENRKQLRERVCLLAGKELPIAIETDARIGLEGAFEGQPGVVIIAGTGSVVIGKTHSDELVTVGGWGRAFGDEGSGYYLGLEALKSLTLHFDRRGGSDLLVEMLAREFDLNSREKIIAAVYQDKFEIPKIAPFVLQAAEQHDEVALRILHTAARELTEQARNLVERLQVTGKIGLAFFGGLIERKNVYSNMLTAKIRERIPSAEIKLPARSPAEGAVLIAIAHLRTA
jgi:N-acetylglucosamine kinase-like BadF-type ATPase